MNSKQRMAVILAGAVMILMLLFPPFQLATGGGVMLNAGYGFLFLPRSVYETVNVSLLLTQWLLVVLLGFGAMFVLKDRQ